MIRVSVCYSRSPNSRCFSFLRKGDLADTLPDTPKLIGKPGVTGHGSREGELL